MEADEIIEAWINQAKRKRLTTHQAKFWMARDILEGVIPVSPRRQRETIEWIIANCKESEQRTTLLKELDRAARV